MSENYHQPPRNHGGARPGAGRKPLSPQGLERTTVTLPPDLLAAAEQIGAGNVSDGVRVALLHWLADNAPAPRELQIWRHAPTGAYYLILWQGALGAAAGPMPLAEAQAVQQGHAPEPAHWPDLADWADAAWERGEMARVGDDNE